MIPAAEVARIRAEGAREALESFAAESANHGLLGRADEARAYSALCYPAPPKRVRAEVKESPRPWKLHGSEWQCGGVRSWGHVSRAAVADMFWAQQQADAEGMVLEEGGEAGGPSLACGFDSATQLGGSIPNESAEATPSPASPARCECGHSLARHQVPRASRWCLDCLCSDYQARTPVPTPAPAYDEGKDLASWPAAPASPESTETRVWWMNCYDGEYGTVVHATREEADACAQSSRLDCIPVVPRAALDALRLQLDEARQYRDRYKAERDKALRAVRIAAHGAIEEHEARLCPEDMGCEELIDSLRAQLAEATRDVTQEEFQRVVDAAGGYSATDINMLCDALAAAERDRNDTRLEAGRDKAMRAVAEAAMMEARQRATAAEAELAGVRKLEVWMREVEIMHYAAFNGELFESCESNKYLHDQRAFFGDSLAALGHALPESPDAT